MCACIILVCMCVHMCVCVNSVLSINFVVVSSLIRCCFICCAVVPLKKKGKNIKGKSVIITVLKSVRVHFAYGSDGRSFFVEYS